MEQASIAQRSVEGMSYAEMVWVEDPGRYADFPEWLKQVVNVPFELRENLFVALSKNEEGTSDPHEVAGDIGHRGMMDTCSYDREERIAFAHLSKVLSGAF